MSSVAKEIRANHKSEYAFFGKMARGGNTVLSFIAVTIVIVLSAYAFYSLLYTYQIYNDANLDSDILDLKPVYSGDTTDNRLTFRELLAINEDTTSWITIDDTLIDYPVMQGENDYEYVNKNIYGDFELSGSIFISAKNEPDYSDPYNLLFGHHIYNGAMFGDVMKYRDEDFFNNHTTGILYLPEATYSISIYACIECSAYDDNIFFAAKEPGEMSEFQEWVRENATQYTDIGITENDKIIALTTCENATTDGRCAVLGRLDQIAMVEQSFYEDDSSVTTNDVDEAENESSGNAITGAYFVRLSNSYYYLIILGVFLLSLLIVGLMQTDNYIGPNASEIEITNLEKKTFTKRKLIHRLLCITNLAVGVICIYYGRTIYEEVSCVVAVGTMSFLSAAERVRRVRSF